MSCAQKHLIQFSNLLSLNNYFFFNDTPTTEIYTLSLHDALPIWLPARRRNRPNLRPPAGRSAERGDRKSTRLNSSHGYISYAVFCLKKKNQRHITNTPPRAPRYAELVPLNKHTQTGIRKINTFVK